MTGRHMPDGKISECNEVKGVALNLTHSPENNAFWEWADPIAAGAGHAEGALQTSANRPPGVADSIELHNGRQVTRRATSKGSWGKAQSSTRVCASM